MEEVMTLVTSHEKEKGGGGQDEVSFWGTSSVLFTNMIHGYMGMFTCEYLCSILKIYANFYIDAYKLQCF